jgi:hypothetical protein
LRARGWRWKKEAKYQRCSLAETDGYRLKALFSERLRSRELESQRAEATVR